MFDRVTGEHLLTTKISASASWDSGIDSKGAPIPDPKKEPQPGGALVSPSNPGIVGWPPPSFDPETGLFYVQTRAPYSIWYLTDPDPREAQGFGGALETALGTTGSFLTAIDYKTGKIAWQHSYPLPSPISPTTGGGGVPGVLTTAGKLLFGSDYAGNLVAYDPGNGTILWHTRLGSAVTNAPETYLLDDRQHLLVVAGDAVFSFTAY